LFYQNGKSFAYLKPVVPINATECFIGLDGPKRIFLANGKRSPKRRRFAFKIKGISSAIWYEFPVIISKTADNNTRFELDPLFAEDSRLGYLKFVTWKLPKNNKKTKKGSVHIVQK